MMRAILGVLVSFAAAGCVTADTAKIEAFVIDEMTGKPLPNVEVTGSFGMNYGLLAVKGSPGPNICKALTDSNGRCRLSAKTNCGEAGCYVRHAPDGYYDFSCGGSRTFKRKDLFGVWQPDNLVITLRVQRVEHPIPLFVKQIGMYEPINQARDIFPAGSDTLRFDMAKGEFLPPVGNGEVADVEFVRLPRQDFGEGVNGAGIKGNSYRDTMKVRFLGEGNGLVEVTPPSGAALNIRQAADTGFIAEYTCMKGRDKELRRETHYKKDRCFCFRIRTRRNDKGEIVEAYYGKIYGDISFCGEYPRGRPCVPVSSVNMRYYLNPTSMDRNLEWSRVNLCPTPGRIDAPNPDL